MNIPERMRKFKGAVGTDLFILIVLVLSSSISFSLGYLAAKDGLKQEVFIDTSAAVYNAEIVKGEGKYVASISGAKYHLPTCSGAKRIKEENKIWFDNKEDAELSGYTPAGNCKGI